MSGSTPSGNDDIIEGDATAFVVGVPKTGQSEFVDYLRLGQASGYDEGFLQEDPAASGASPTLISKQGTTSPFSDGQLAYTTGTMQLVAPYSYIRLGTATTYETWLPPSTSSPDGTVQPDNGGSFPSKGVVIYSNDTLQTFAPSINQTTSEFSQWQDDSLSVVMNGSDVMAANRTLGSSGWSASFQRAAQLNTVLGSITTAITGQNITQWLGNDASTGLGSLLWSNYGSTQNVFGGQVVNLINSSVDVQGWGETKVGSDITTVATGSIILAANPVAAAVGVSATAVSNRISMAVGIIATAVEVAMDIISDVTVTEMGKVNGQNSADMRTATDVAFGAIGAASVAVLVIQAMAIITGVVASVTGSVAGKTPLAGIILSEYGTQIQCGTSVIYMSSAGGIYTSSPTQLNNVLTTTFSV